MLKIVFFALIAITVADHTCPPPEVLYPCECRDLGPLPIASISCKYTPVDFNLKQVFDNASAFVNDDVVFDYLAISNTNLSSIEEGAIEHLKFNYIDIRENPHLRYISPRAFNASGNTTNVMWLYDNPIENERPFENDIFEFIRSFKKLESLYLVRSRVSSIPPSAFENMTELGRVWMYENPFSTVGSRAFYNTPNLHFLDWFSNQILPEGHAEDAFIGIGSKFRVNLECNLIDYLDEKIFKPLLDHAEHVNLLDIYIRCRGSEYQRLYCDERADWICGNAAAYRRILNGYSCKEGTSHRDVWDYCESRNNTV